MVVYICKRCDDRFEATKNTEKSRKQKKAFKAKHHKDKGCRWVRYVVKPKQDRRRR